MIDFKPFPKIARYSRDIVVTEKLDGTNAQVFIGADGQVLAGSRNQWVTPEKDNYGFATWVEANREELLKLGEGSHFGEWWGAGIQRKYGLTEKRFSLFNTHKWSDPAVRPACCHVVPVLYAGPHDSALIEHRIQHLLTYGSVAAPGFMKPEGVVIYHTASGLYFKKTCEKDNEHKGQG